jgi:hypothetical protein
MEATAGSDRLRDCGFGDQTLQRHSRYARSPAGVALSSITTNYDALARCDYSVQSVMGHASVAGNMTTTGTDAKPAANS